MSVRGCSLALALLVGLVPACGSRPAQTADGGGDANADRLGSGAAGTGGMASAGTTGGAGTGAAGTGAGGTAGTGSGVAGSGAAGSAGMAGMAGGAGKGGASGTAGGAGTGGASGAAPGPECTTAADCKLFSDCCTCAAVPIGETVASCPAICKQNQCEALLLPGGAVACVAGRCVAGFACDASKVTCKIAVPDCQAGAVPAVDESGNCYTGLCVPAAECTSVTACASCTRTDQACVSYSTLGGSHHHCVTIPPACGGDPTCDCLAESCVAPYRACGPLSGVKGVGCACPGC